MIRNNSTTFGIGLADPNNEKLEASTSSSPALVHLIATPALFIAEGQVLEINAAARSFLGDGLIVRQGKLRAVNAGDQSAIDALMTRALARSGVAADSELVAVSRLRGGKPLMVRALPVGPTGNWGNSLLILIADPERRIESDPVPALRLLGLTPRRRGWPPLWRVASPQEMRRGRSAVPKDRSG